MRPAEKLASGCYNPGKIQRNPGLHVRPPTTRTLPKIPKRQLELVTHGGTRPDHHPSMKKRDICKKTSLPVRKNTTHSHDRTAAAKYSRHALSGRKSHLKPTTQENPKKPQATRPTANNLDGKKDTEQCLGSVNRFY